MLNLPISNNIPAMQSRVRKIISVARAEGDCLLLQQLWCLLRNAEIAMAPSANKTILHKMRENVMQEMTALGQKLVPVSSTCSPAEIH